MIEQKVMEFLATGPRGEQEIVIKTRTPRSSLRRVLLDLVLQQRLTLDVCPRTQKRTYSIPGWQRNIIVTPKLNKMERPEYKHDRAMQYALERMGGLRPKVVLAGRLGVNGLGG